MAIALKLVIGNKNYSSWSMRPWVLLREAGIPFTEVQLQFDDAAKAIGVEGYSPTRLVPVLMVDGVAVWDSMAICETISEMFPEKMLWPSNVRARQVARSISAEMHAGFRELRQAMPMNIRSCHPGKGMTAEVRRDIDRISSIWQSCREEFGAGGDMLFGRFGIADAYFAPVVMRFVTHAVELTSVARAYLDSVLALSSVREWAEAARRETGFIAAAEPYATNP